MIAAIARRSPMTVKAHVSPAFRSKTRPQMAQRSTWDHPENSRPTTQYGQRLRSPRRNALRMNPEGGRGMHKCRMAPRVHCMKKLSLATALVLLSFVTLAAQRPDTVFLEDLTSAEVRDRLEA